MEWVIWIDERTSSVVGPVVVVEREIGMGYGWHCVPVLDVFVPPSLVAVEVVL